jgi:hypothetical protein
MKKSLFARLALISAAVLPVASFAAADAAFTGAVTTVTADIAIYGAALVGVAAVGVTFMIAMKYVKKIRGAA